eukprot:CAMPEP_0204824446 /NCGR_PEP_ID=MMETSP1346-20131115/2471_1 /ASSEMBLY_ACC=CAM_ASM_000771 /TAXON_ID=215587 /ORGANISM="Aplanochytrium stocchinoi, Strain GSBS06" /LENGTH=207 /DNA_ID=CAMNT_0051951613 /DNA_START=595 /DNA_END=1218 /DNA_ORIENTATION=+
MSTAEQFIDAVVNKQSPPKDKNGKKFLVDKETWNKNNEKGRRALLEAVVDDDEVAHLLTANGISFDVAEGLEDQGAEEVVALGIKNMSGQVTKTLEGGGEEVKEGKKSFKDKIKGFVKGAKKAKEDIENLGNVKETGGAITTAEQFIDAVVNNATAPKDEDGKPLMRQDLWDTADPAQRKQALENVVDVDNMAGYLQQNNMSGFGRR